ncbi:MAG: DegT/DnrJ/EryC1/StrS aminotransferase family protein, partial [Calditrichia bacterium]|nr:DegT/DnrJ/EryC1/StrS aminotransferase family protein [Calditrichia bacterium]
MNIPLNSSIIIPAYSCPQVATAVLKAGHKPVLCDISLETLAYESDLLIKRINEVDAKAVVVVNLFGLNDKIPDLDIPVIVDNAQQYPFVVNKNITAEIYSFGRGKPLNSLSGGVAIINNYNSFENVKEKYES